MSFGRALPSQPQAPTPTAPLTPLTPLPPVTPPPTTVAAVPEWGAESPDGAVWTTSLARVCRDAGTDAGSGAFARLRPIPTGFDALDQWIGGGLRQGELLLLGGAQGVGKTTLCLQVARNVAAPGAANVLYACYEHPEEYVLNRLLVQETIDPTAPGPHHGLSLDDLQAYLVEAQEARPGSPFYEPLLRHPLGARALAAFEQYAGRFHLVAEAARRSSLDVLENLVASLRARDDQPLVLFVDYLQKVTPAHDSADEAERMTEVVQGLKALALHHSVAVVAIVAAEKEGLKAPRLRFTHLRGSSALMYEADVAIIMNDKWHVIDREHIVFNLHKAQQFRDWVVCTIEKNRGGRNLVEVEFQKRFDYCCFNPRGGKVAERLYEERIQGERS